MFPMTKPQPRYVVSTLLARTNQSLNNRQNSKAIAMQIIGQDFMAILKLVEPGKHIASIGAAKAQYLKSAA
jgi:hypothetical protein